MILSMRFLFIYYAATVTGIGNYEGSVSSATYEITTPLNLGPVGGTLFSNWRCTMHG